MRWLAVLAVAVLACSPVQAHATSTGMVLTTESFDNGPAGGTGDLPTWCYHEDSTHTRAWQGTLGPGESFSVPLRFCTPDEAPPYGPGPSGFMYTATFWTGHQTVDLHVVFPDGTMKQSHLVYPNEWQGCVMPAFKPSYRPEGTMVQTIAPGTYQVVLTNTGTKPISVKAPLHESILVMGGYLNTQTAYCPPEDQNIVAA